MAFVHDGPRRGRPHLPGASLNEAVRAVAESSEQFETTALRQAKPCDSCGLLRFFARKVDDDSWLCLDLAPVGNGDWVIVAWNVDDKPVLYVAAIDPDEDIGPAYLKHRCRTRGKRS